MEISKDELKVMTFYSSKIDGYPSGNEHFKYEKALIFSVWNVCNVAEACAAWLNEQVSPVQSDGGADGEQNQTEKAEKKCRVGFSSLFDLWLSKTMPKNISYEIKSLHDRGTLSFWYDIAVSFLNIGIFFLIYFKTAMLKSKKTNKQTDGQKRQPRKRTLSQVECFFLVSLGTAPVSVCLWVHHTPHNLTIVH